MAGTKDKSKVAINLRVTPATLAQVEDLRRWLGPVSKNWVWEHAVERWHAQEQARQQAAEVTGDGAQARGKDRGPALYDLLSDTAAAIVALPTRVERDVAAAHLAGELVAGAEGAGLSLADLRALVIRLQTELTDALAREVAK